MGRHADPDPRHFWRSLGVACLRASAGLMLVVGLFAVLSSIDAAPEPADGPVMLGGPDRADEADPRSPAVEPGGEPGVDRSPTAGGDATPETPEAEPGTPGAEPSPAGAAPEADDEALIAAAPSPAETTVQVLDGVGGSSHVDRLVTRLEDLGYAVVAINPASADYATTTVFFSAGYEDAARALQAREPRIIERHPNPGWSEQVHLHVVLGADWRP